MMRSAIDGSEPFVLPRRWRTPRPSFVISLAAILFVMAVGVGILEITQSRKEIMALLEREARSLAEALSLSGENAVRAYSELESTLENGLLATAEILAQEEASGRLTADRLAEILRSHGIVRAFAVDENGRIDGLAFPTGAEADFRPGQVLQLVRPLFQSGKHSVSGYVEDGTGATHYAVAVRQLRAGARQGAWVVCADPKSLLRFRRRVGIGRLIQDLGESSEIAYIALQDSVGIISASKNVATLTSLASDPFLAEALAQRESKSRLSTFQGEQVFEVAKPFTVDGVTFGLFRVGLRMDAVRHAVTRTKQRAVAVGVGLLVVGVLLFNFLVTHQNYGLLTDAYSRIHTYTGNILENMADAVVAVDREGRITLFNRAAEKLFNRSAEEAIGKHCGDILGRQQSLLDQALATGVGVRDQEVSYHLGDRRATLLVTTTLLRGSDGSIHSAVAVLKDLTEKKALEASLRQRERLSAMGELAAGVAHEIRNPLNAIAMIAQRFEKEFVPKEGEAEYRQLARAVVAETRRVSEIVQRFLEFARPPQLQLRDIDLSEVAARAARLVQSQALQQEITLETDLLPNLILPLDSNQMEQVLLNLLQNSLHATPRGGRIRVRSYRRADEIVAEVQDTGLGIPQENLNKIFDLYFTTKETGTGMGLSLSHRIVSEHGGRMEVESEVGKGTTVRVVLPLASRPDEPVEMAGRRELG